MKICIFGDVHWSKNSSIVNQVGNKYSVRLEKLILSMNWVNDLAIKNNCDMMICDGDFFDRSQLTDVEVTAAKEINWNNLQTYFLVGNHESSIASLKYNTVKLLESPNHFIISESKKIKKDDFNLYFIPYIVESDRKALITYLKGFNKDEKNIIVSHADIAGISYGPIESKVGFSLDEIKDLNCLFCNGHIHNSSFITNKILNIGSLSAHNFTNDSTKYSYGAWILDTDTLKLTFYENPYAFNFYKFEIHSETDFNILNKLKNNSVLSIKCDEIFVNNLKEKLESVKNKIVCYKIIVIPTIVTDGTEIKAADLSIDYISKFIECAKNNIENSKILEEEISEICK